MKQILQDIKNGKTFIIESPAIKCQPGTILIRTTHSLISTGTEKSLIEFGKANIIKKSFKEPEKVKEVIQKIKTDGIVTTYNAVKGRLEQPLPLGYCNAGIIIEIGDGVKGYNVGDRVASCAPHSNLVRVPINLTAKIPKAVTNESACFTAIASIALQGIRLAKPTLGEKFVVTGLGLIGLIAVQLLIANGCSVMGIDYDDDKLLLAKQFGAKVVNLSKGENPIEAAYSFSKCNGVDGVLIAASSKSSKPIRQAAEMCRVRGRIISIGVVGLSLERETIFRKEITVKVSHSFGPGRHDINYEKKGQDYPLGFVRWSLKRNFDAILDLMDSGKLNVIKLISKRVKLDNVIDAYESLTKNSSLLGVVISYPKKASDQLLQSSIKLNDAIKTKTIPCKPVCAFIGAGNYASRILIPSFKRNRANLDTIITDSGVSGVFYGIKNKFRSAASTIEVAFENHQINTVVIATRHNTHAKYIISALEKDKNIFVEKPLAITIEEIKLIKEAYSKACNKKNGVKPILMVGFNRRFAPHILKLKKLLDAKSQPKVFNITMNAGMIDQNHWIQDSEIGGGRIIGEACHLIDLIIYLAGETIIDFQVVKLGKDDSAYLSKDNVSITLKFLDGSYGNINYLSNGGKKFPKERIEVFCEGGTIQIDNFRRMKGYNWPNFGKMNLFVQDKGHENCVKLFLDSIIKGNDSPICFDEIVRVSELSIKVNNYLET